MPAVFGDYIDIYDIARAVEDGATVPIYYESRLARIELDEDEKPKIDAEIAELTEDEAQTEQDRLKRKWASVEALVGSDKRLTLVADSDAGVVVGTNWAPEIEKYGTPASPATARASSSCAYSKAEA
jgi:hypothetical protein